MKENILYYKKPAKYWTQALPMGNGSLGAMFFSGVGTDRISLNHDTLWSGRPFEIKNDKAFESYQTARSLALDGKLYEAEQELKNNFLAGHSQAYMPLCELYLNFGNDKYSEYSRRLDLSSAVLTSSHRSGDISYEKTAFVSHPHDVVVYQIKANGGKLSFSLNTQCQLKSKIYIEDDTLIIDGECPGDADTHWADYPCFERMYFDEDKMRGVPFRAAAKIVCDGIITSDNDSVTVSNATKATLYFVTKTGFNGFDKHPVLEGREYCQLCLDTLDAAVSAGYDAVKAAHIKDFSSYYNRITLDLESKDYSKIPTDKRLKKAKKSHSDTGLYTLLWNFGRYLLISCSRENSAAANLQGIWNEHLKAPWSSNYTTNINTEMNYWPALMCNLPELIEPLFEFIRALSVTGEAVAREFYHARGFVSHHNCDIWGCAAPVSGEPKWSYWQGSSGWLCRFLYEYYEYTLDRQFLSDTAFPLMKKAALFYLDILYEDADGVSFVCPATSPENSFFHNGKKVTAVAKSSAMMNSIVLDLFLNCKSSCEILGIDDEFYKDICAAASKIQPLQIGSKGQIIEWDSEYAETEVHHRHVSHLYALHPAGMITKEKTPELFNASRKTLEIRGDDGTGWSLAWKINFWARLRDGNRALKLLNRQLNPVIPSRIPFFKSNNKSGTYENLFDAHPPFQIDGNFGTVSGICEMLLQSDESTIYILPALPDEWKNGCIKGLRARGNVTVDIEWKNGKLTDCQIHGNSDNIKVVYCR